MRQNDPAPVAIEFSLFKAGARVENPTIALNDAKIAIGGAGQVNTTNLPTTDGAGKVSWLPTQAETNATIVTFFMLDVIGAQWEPVTIYFDTRTETAVWLYLDATVSSCGTADPGDAMTLTGDYDAAKTAAQAGDEMALTAGERTTLSQTIWDQLLASMIAPNSIGEFLAALNNFDPTTQGVIVDNMLASALEAFFTVNSGSTYAASIAGSVVKEIADNASGGGGGGSGAIEWVITIEDNLGTPIVGADVWATLGTTPDIDIVASGMTNVLGEVTFYLDAGTYYIWVQKSGINFSNPTAVVVV